jgi:hypothetical protein
MPWWRVRTYEYSREALADGVLRAGMNPGATQQNPPGRRLSVSIAYRGTRWALRLRADRVGCLGIFLASLRVVLCSAMGELNHFVTGIQMARAQPSIDEPPHDSPDRIQLDTDNRHTERNPGSRE